MNEDKDIELLFSKAVKEFDDNEELMARVSSMIETSPKMRMIDAVNRISEQQNRRNRLALYVACATGVILGLLVMLCFRTHAATFPWLNEVILSVTAGCASICIAFCVREISVMKNCRCKNT